MLIFQFVVVGVFITELVLSVLWTPFYFKTGIPLFHKSFRFDDANDAPGISDTELSHAIKRIFTSPVLFHSLSTNEIAFRESWFGLRLVYYPPMMHGLIRVDDLNKQVSVTGYIYWWYLCFVVLVVVYGSSSLIWLVVLITAMTYLIQFFLFRKIFNYLVEKHLQHVSTSPSQPLELS